MKHFLVVICLIGVMTTVGYSQNLQWRWSKSSFSTTPEANATHFVGSAFLADYFERKGMTWWQADLTSFGFGLAWEIKDGFVDYRQVPVVGAEGFSKMDLLVDISGILANRLINVGLEKIFKLSKPKKQPLPEDIYY